jgi:hypothetical protein
MIERRGFLRLAMGAVALMGTLGVPRGVLERARTWVVYGSGQDGDMVLTPNQMLDDSRRYEALDYGFPIAHPRLEIYAVRTLQLPRALDPDTDRRTS